MSEPDPYTDQCPPSIEEKTMSAMLIRTPVNWRNMLAIYALVCSFVWGMALGVSGGDFRPKAFLAAVERSATLGLDLAGIKVMSAEAYARGELAKQAEIVMSATALTQPYTVPSDYKYYAVGSSASRTSAPTALPSQTGPVGEPVPAQ
jgi:hypothetical protein